MEYYKIGLNWNVSRIIYGCGALGLVDFGKSNISDLKKSVYAALDNGITAFDTADVYGLGVAEELLSKILGSKRKEVFISTKGGVNWERNSTTRANTFIDCSPNHIQEAIDNSLKRLKIDSIPLYFIHWPDNKTPLSDILELLTKNLNHGKIQHIGLSNFSKSEIKLANNINKIDVLQNKYNLIYREAEKDIFPFIRKSKTIFWGYAPLAQGFLACKYQKKYKFDSNDHRSRLPHFSETDTERNSKIQNLLSNMAKEKKADPSQIAIRWVLKHPFVNSVIVGSKNKEQSSINACSVDIHMTETEYNILKLTLQKDCNHE